MYRGPYKYKILLAGDANNRKVDKRIYNEKAINFSSPLTDNYLPKLYVISIDKEIVYVGYTFQSMTTRLNSGLKANGKSGYKWKNVQDELELSVFVFQALYGKPTKEYKKYYLFIEALESELVYLVRNKTGNWPKYQNEIRCHYELSKTAKTRAEEIYEKIMA